MQTMSGQGSGQALKAFFKRFWVVLVSIGGLAGSYWGAVAIKAEQFFLPIVGVALLVAGAKPGVKLLNDVVTRYRGYPNQARELVELRANLNREITAGRDKDLLAVSEYERGVKVGSLRSLGASLGRAVETMPVIESLTTTRGEIAFAARYLPESRPPIGAWLSVEVTGTGEIKGSVMVVQDNESQGTVILRCCERLVPEFWEHLQQRSVANPDPPRSVRLTPYVDPDLHNVDADEAAEGPNDDR